jgi:hypothetical protein
MRLRHLLLLPLVAALFCVAKTAYALWVQYDLSPKTLTFNGRTFFIESKTRSEDGLQQFEVVITPTAGAQRPRISPFTTGYLTLSGEAGRVAHVPIEGKSEGSKVRYWFRVAPASVPYSRFEIHESNYITTRMVKGEAREEIMLGGILYTMSLKEFPTGTFGSKPGGK